MKHLKIEELIIEKKVLPRRKAIYSPFPEQLDPEIQNYLRKQDIEELYCHQAEMFELAQKRKNIVITTATASGKTLSFLLPVLQEILKNPLTRALFIYPTKALASDQYRALEPYLSYFGENRICAGVYDGDTPVSERSRIRQKANIILTNPEMISGAFLPNHSKYGFDFLFSNLKYVVVDELHTYRGAFGSHMANVFRRLQRVCNYYHATPQYLFSSATIANPLQLAENISGRKFVQVTRDGSPSQERTYLLVQPPKVMGKDQKYYGQIQTTTVAAELIPQLVEDNTSFIAFAKSRRNVEIVLKESRDKLEAESFFGGDLKGKISGYRGGYTPMERKEIEQKMITGELCGLVSTNALELGIDIGKIDTTILVGYPGTRASFWQQTGRAGRSNRKSTSYLLLDNLPFDQYIAINPEWLFASSSENAVIDKDNLLIQLVHIRAAAAEIPLTLDDIALFPDLGETIPVLMRAHELNGVGGKFAWCGSAYPAGDISMRNIDKLRYKLINQENNQDITEMDELQAYQELHEGAIYLHDGVQYQVVKLDRETRTAYGVPFNGNYYTMPGGNTEINIIHKELDKAYERVKVTFGDVNVNDVVVMYKKLQFHNHQNLGYEQLREPLSKDYDTESVWMRIPQNVVSVFRRLLQVGDNGEVVRNNHFEGLCHAIKNAAMMVTMTEKDDIGVSMSNNAVGLSDNPADEVYLFVYDKFVGGLGYAEKIYDCIPQIIENAIEMVGGCNCEDGCAACIGDYMLDKKIVLWGLQNMVKELEAPKEMKLAEYAKRLFIRKAFVYQNLPEQWQEFCKYLKANGDSMAQFLSSVEKVEQEGNSLTLYVDNTFLRDWILQDENRKSISNIVKFYSDAPQSLRLEVQTTEEKDSRSIRKKLEKRYEEL